MKLYFGGERSCFASARKVPWTIPYLLPNSGTDVTLGTTESVLGAFSKEGADFEKRLCPDSSTMFGRTFVTPPTVLGPHVLPFTPSAGTARIKI